MDLFGIGPLELAAVLLVATLVLGPAKMVDTARSMGKFWGEAQRLLRETADAATAKLDVPPGHQETPKQTAGLAAPEGAVASGPPQADPTPTEDQPPPTTSAMPPEETQQHG